MSLRLCPKCNRPLADLGPNVEGRYRLYCWKDDLVIDKETDLEEEVWREKAIPRPVDRQAERTKLSQLGRSELQRSFKAEDLLGKQVFDSQATKVGDVRRLLVSPDGSWHIVVEKNGRNLTIDHDKVSAVGELIFLKIRTEDILVNQHQTIELAEEPYPSRGDALSAEEKPCDNPNCEMRLPKNAKFCDNCGATQK